MTQSEPPPPVATPCHMAWGAQALWEQLVGDLPGLSVEVVARISSTNSALLDRARVGNGTLDDEEGHAGDAVLVKRSTESRAFGRRAVAL
jgi:BirA family transcriptional regulator, biotin operon repressor / biotin---[acetyl-CoA-carboxylase] ligase